MLSSFERALQAFSFGHPPSTHSGRPKKKISKFYIVCKKNFNFFCSFFSLPPAPSPSPTKKNDPQKKMWPKKKFFFSCPAAGGGGQPCCPGGKKTPAPPPPHAVTAWPRFFQGKFLQKNRFCGASRSL